LKDFHPFLECHSLVAHVNSLHAHYSALGISGRHIYNDD
jgi:hypothetical protein